MTVLVWMILGAAVGWSASLITQTDYEMGVPANIVVGVVGALTGGWFITLFGGENLAGFITISFVVAVIAAVVLLWIVRGFRTPLSGQY